MFLRSTTFNIKISQLRLIILHFDNNKTFYLQCVFSTAFMHDNNSNNNIEIRNDSKNFIIIQSRSSYKHNYYLYITHEQIGNCKKIQHKSKLGIIYLHKKGKKQITNKCNGTPFTKKE